MDIMISSYHNLDIHILQMRNTSHREVKQLPQHHTASKSQPQILAEAVSPEHMLTPLCQQEKSASETWKEHHHDKQ